MSVFKSYLSKLKQIFHKQFVRNTLWLFVARMLGLVMQLAYFIIIARTLNAQEYGLFIGIAAMAALVMSFASLGSGDVLIQRVSRDRHRFREYWGKALLQTAIASVLLISLCLAVSQYLFPATVPPIVIFLILFSDLFCITLWNIAGHAFASVDRLKHVAYTDFFYGVSKLAAAVILMQYFSNQGLTAWAWLYCSSSIVTALFSVALVNHELGYPNWKNRWHLSDLKEGMYFSVGQSADRINGDIDKTMLASAATLSAAGVYGAADRLITALYTPLHVLFSASYMRFFKHGDSGISGSLQFSKRLFPAVLGYGTMSGLGLLFFSPLIIFILGDSYQETIEVLKFLSPYILILGIQNLAADSLTGAGFQSVRSVTHIGSAVFNFLLNLWLIPLYSWKGAAVATLISDTVKTVLLWLSIFVLCRRSQHKNYARESRLTSSG